jgi:sugar/nucleoside kinase (ribokinase family)
MARGSGESDARSSCWHQSTRVMGKEEIKDATGAGDAFIAGFLMAWLGNGGNAAEALR